MAILGYLNLLIKNHDLAKIPITDNGVGMDKKTTNKLFKLNEHYINRGTEDEEGKG